MNGLKSIARCCRPSVLRTHCTFLALKEMCEKPLYDYGQSSFLPVSYADECLISLRYISVDAMLQRLERHSFYNLNKITHM